MKSFIIALCFCLFAVPLNARKVWIVSNNNTGSKLISSYIHKSLKDTEWKDSLRYFAGNVNDFYEGNKYISTGDYICEFSTYKKSNETLLCIVYCIVDECHETVYVNSYIASYNNENLEIYKVEYKDNVLTMLNYLDAKYINYSN